VASQPHEPGPQHAVSLGSSRNTILNPAEFLPQPSRGPGAFDRVRRTLSTSFREGVDVAVIALWLGHADIRSTNAYLHADMTIKERAMARLAAPSTGPSKYRPPDVLLAFLENL